MRHTGTDEAFPPGTFGAQSPMVEIDGQANGGRAGPVFHRIRRPCKDLIATRRD